jgi:thioredoxin reductase (NADPH)
MSNQTPQYDVIVVGAGPAGLTAAIYASWLGLETLVLDSAIAGGKAWLAPQIENFPGFEEGIKGNELTEKMERQATRLGAKIQTSEEVVDLDLSGEVKRAVSRNNSYLASALIIATGTQKKKLHVPGEAEFFGKGISYCATCDGAFFRKAKVAIIGNGEEAAIDALHLAGIAEKVALVTQGKQFKVEGSLKEKLLSKPNVELIIGEVTAILGKQTVTAVRIRRFDASDESDVDVKGVFISLGGVPMTQIVRRAGIETDRGGCLNVDRTQRTNIEGVFAAGDCTCGGMQIVTAAGEGAMAAMKASAYVRRRKKL